MAFLTLMFHFIKNVKMAKIDIGDTIEIDSELVKKHGAGYPKAQTLKGKTRVVLDLTYDEDSSITLVKVETGEIIPLSCCKRT